MAADTEPPGNANVAARLAGLALTVACWVSASTAPLDPAWRMVLVWGAPLLTFPIARLGRRSLDADPTRRRARSVTVVVHYGMMIVLGSALFPAFRALLNLPTLTLPVVGPVIHVTVLLTGFATLLTVLNLAARGLGAPFALKLSTRLATDWMYARTRNPMLFCTLAWFLFLGIWHQSGGFVLFLAVSVTPGWIYFVKVYEERELEIRFGAEYAAYRAQTPFLFPRLTGSVPPRVGGERTSG